MLLFAFGLKGWAMGRSAYQAELTLQEMTKMAAKDLTPALTDFLSSVNSKLKHGIGQAEEQLRAPFEALMHEVADFYEMPIDLVGEVSLGSVRPDYAVAPKSGGPSFGLVELKAPGVGVDSKKFTGRNLRQWERLSDLPNVLYFDGQELAVYQSGVLTFGPETICNDISAGLGVTEEGLAVFHAGMHHFLRWQPTAPRSAKALADLSARLCRLLRDTTLEALEHPDLETPTGLANLAEDWRHLLFPDATNEAFADSYAQTVTFGLLLARAQGIDFEGTSLRAIAELLGKSYSLIGRALEVVATTDRVGDGAIDALHRTLSAVDWSDLTDDNEEQAWVYFYEHFLESYDPQLRKDSGSYYTPPEVVRSMTRLVEELLKSKFDLSLGFASSEVHVLDPAMGTGTFLLEVVDRASTSITEKQGDAVAKALESLATRLIGFEKMTGPYAVAHLRLFAAFKRAGLEISDEALCVYVADTLDSPNNKRNRLGDFYAPIAKSAEEANNVKNKVDVMVVLGNPPYKDKAAGHGGWIESGEPEAGQRALLDDFMPPEEWGAGTHSRHLYNLNVYFWRWAIWKAFEANPEADDGVVAFITTAAFLDGPGFQKMRSHLRSVADEIHVIRLSPEGHRPPVATRVFPGVQQPLAITIASRSRGASLQQPADVYVRTVEPGDRAAKFAELETVSISDAGWRSAPSDWRDPFDSVTSTWSDLVSVKDIFPWTGTGIMAGRTWVFAPSTETLKARWKRLLMAKTDSPERAALFKEHERDRNLRTVLKTGLPGQEHHRGSIGKTTGPIPAQVPVGFRSFDRQYVIADKRLLNQPNPSLWQTASTDQVYLTYSHNNPNKSGPGIVATNAIPEVDHYHGRGGRVAPFWKDRAATQPNLTTGLADQLSAHLGIPIQPLDILHYVIGVTAHPAYTRTFQSDLTHGGPRIPFTTDPDLFREAVTLGKTALEITTRPKVGNYEARVTNAIPHTDSGMPDQIDWADEQLHIGDGRIGPVSEAVWNYDVNGMSVIRSWFGYRRKHPSGNKSSDLDNISTTSWTAQYTTDLLELIATLDSLVALEDSQARVLAQIVQSTLVTQADLEDAQVLPPGAADRKKPSANDGGPLFPVVDDDSDPGTDSNVPDEDAA